MPIDKKREFICPVCGDMELVLVRSEVVSLSMFQSEHSTEINGWNYGKETVLDCLESDVRCGRGHMLTLKDGSGVQTEEELEEWFEENAEWIDRIGGWLEEARQK